MQEPSGLLFKRIVIAALLARLIPVLVLVVVVTVYSFWAIPGQAEDQYAAFAKKTGQQLDLYIGPLATLLMAYWAARKPVSQQVQHGLFTGILTVVIDLAILATPGAEFDFTVALAMALKLAAGILGGYLALKQFNRQAASTTPGHRIT